MGGLSSICLPGIRCFTASAPLRRSWACAWLKGSRESALDMAQRHIAGAAGTRRPRKLSGRFVLRRDRRAFCCFGGASGETPSWLPMALMFCLFLAAWKIMGYGHATDAAQATLKEHIAWQWWALALWLIVGLGFRIVAFRWISRPLKDPLSALVLASAMGFLAFSFLFQLAEGKERYGIHFLQCIFSHICLLPAVLRMLAGRRTIPNDRRVGQGGENHYDLLDRGWRIDRLRRLGDSSSHGDITFWA